MAEPARTRAAYAREAVAWSVAVLVAGVLLPLGVGAVFAGADPPFAGAGPWSSFEEEMGYGVSERSGRNVCGERLDWLATFWLHHSNDAQVAVGVLAVLAALAVYVAATFGWRRVAVAALLLGVAGLIVLRIVGHHADAAFWNGSSPGEDSWSSHCADGAAGRS